MRASRSAPPRCRCHRELDEVKREIQASGGLAGEGRGSKPRRAPRSSRGFRERTGGGSTPLRGLPPVPLRVIFCCYLTLPPPLPFIIFFHEGGGHRGARAGGAHLTRRRGNLRRVFRRPGETASARGDGQADGACLGALKARGGQPCPAIRSAPSAPSPHVPACCSVQEDEMDQKLDDNGRRALLAEARDVSAELARWKVRWLRQARRVISSSCPPLRGKHFRRDRHPGPGSG